MSDSSSEYELLRCDYSELRTQNSGLRCFFVHNGFAYHFLDGGDAVVNGAQTRFAQADHAVANAGRAQLVGRSAVGNEVADVIVHNDQLVDAGAAFVAGVVAAIAAAAVVELLAA